MPRRRATASPSPKTKDDAYSTKSSNVIAEQKSRRATAADEFSMSVANHARDARLHMSRKSAYSSQSDRHQDKQRTSEWSLRQAMKLYSSQKRQSSAEEDNSSLSSERSAKSSESRTSSSAEFPTSKSHQAQRRAPPDAPPTQRTSMRGQAEQRDSLVAVTTQEAGVGGAQERSASSTSSRMSISSSASQAEAPSATARATKRPIGNSTEAHSSAKKHSSDSSAEVAAELDDDQRRRSSSASHRSRSAAVEQTATGAEGRAEAAANDKDALTAARPMNRYERVERYLERSNIPALPTTNVTEDTQQARHHRRHKHSSRPSGGVEDLSRKAPVSATMPAQLRRGGRARSNSDNDSDNQNDAKEDITRKQHRRSDGNRSAKKRRHRSPIDHVKYSFPPFDEPSTKKKRKRREKRHYESSSSSGSSSTKDSLPENVKLPPLLPEARRKHPEAVEQQHQRPHRTLSQSSSDGSWNHQPRNGHRQTAAAAPRCGSMDSVMPTRNHKLSKAVEINSLAAAKCYPDGDHGRRHRNYGRSAATSKTTEARHDENDNELLINEADKDQWRKYFADLYTFNMLQKIKSSKKHKKKRHRDDMDADNDEDDGDVERQNKVHPAPPEAISGDVKAAGFDSISRTVTVAESHPTMNYYSSHRPPFGNGSVANVMPSDALSSSRAPPPPPPPPPPTTSHHDSDLGACNSWPGLIAKPSTTSTVDEGSGRQALLPLPNEPIPLFSLNLSGVMPSVSHHQLVVSCHYYSLTK